jgi:hypothetical protein
VLRTRRFGSLLAVALVATPLSSTTTHATTIRAQPVAANLRVPVTFAPPPDGRIFYGELNSGQVRIYNSTTGANILFLPSLTYSPKTERRTGQPGLCRGPDDGN